MARAPRTVKLSGRSRAGKAKYDESKHKRDVGGKYADQVGKGDDAPKKGRRASSPPAASGESVKLKTRDVKSTDQIVILDKGLKRYKAGMTVQDYIDTLPGERDKALRRLARDHKEGRIGFSSGVVGKSVVSDAEFNDRVDGLKMIQSGKFSGQPENPIPRVDRVPPPEGAFETLQSGTWKLESVDPKSLVSGQEWVNADKLKSMKSVDSSKLSDEERYPTAIRRDDGTYRILDGNHRAAYALLSGEPIKVRVLGEESADAAAAGLKKLDDATLDAMKKVFPDKAHLLKDVATAKKAPAFSDVQAKLRSGESVESIVAARRAKVDDAEARWSKAASTDLSVSQGSTSLTVDSPVLKAVGQRPITNDDDSDVAYYTGSGYDNINGALRRGEEMSAGVAGRSRRLDKLVDSRSVGEDVVLYRGIGETGGLNNMPPPAEFVDRGFSSLSMVPGVSKGFSGVRSASGAVNKAMFRVRVPAGAKAAFITRQYRVGQSDDAVSTSALRDEAELLFPRNSRFRFVKDSGVQKVSGSDVHVIDVELVV